MLLDNTYLEVTSPGGANRKKSASRCRRLDMGDMSLVLGWEDPLEEKMAAHSSILAWKIPWTERPRWLQSMGPQRVRHDWASEHVCFLNYHYSLSVQSLSHVWLFVTPWTAAPQAFLSITSSWSLFKLMSIESVMAPNQLILWRPLLLPPSILPSIRVLWVSSSHQVACCTNCLGASDENEDRTWNLVPWVGGEPATSMRLRCRVHSESSFKP